MIAISSLEGILLRIIAFLLLILLQGCLIVRVAPWRGSGDVKRRDLPKIKQHQGDRVWSLFAPDAIPAIDEPEFVVADDADFMQADEAVIGVVKDGVAKAYSLWHLDRHEIVNDWFGATPVAVTW